MAGFALVPMMRDKTAWLNVDAITRIMPNGKGSDIFMLGGQRLLSEKSPDELAPIRFEGKSTFMRLLMITRWAGEIETDQGWINVNAVSSVFPGELASEIHMADGGFVGTPHTTEQLMRVFNDALKSTERHEILTSAKVT